MRPLTINTNEHSSTVAEESICDIWKESEMCYHVCSPLYLDIFNKRKNFNNEFLI